jgi:nucleotide-binding universal stress UspA family protein
VIVFITQDFDVIPMEGAVSDEAIVDAKRYLERAAGDLRKLGLKVTTRVESGRVADTIIDYSEKHAVDLIVMSTHGRTGPARWLIGSVADRFIHGGQVPVLWSAQSAEAMQGFYPVG